MAERASIRFLHRGEISEVEDFSPTTTLLDWLRIERRLTGTKEGCNEGDCGACTVAIGTPARRQGHLRARQCLHPASRHARRQAELVVVDDLAEAGELHPVQQALVDHHASQCGFCTPGFVMGLFTLYHAGGPAPERQTVTDWLAGNLCRCTGYRPIVDAALAACASTGRRPLCRATRSNGGNSWPRCADGDGCLHRQRRTLLRRPASRDEPRPPLCPSSRCNAGLRRHRRGPVDHQAAARPAARSSISAASPASHDISRDRRWADPRRRGHLPRRPCRSRPPRSRHRRGGAAARLAPGARGRHHRRQHRQRLAHRRHPAHAYRAGRHDRSRLGQGERSLQAGGFLHRLRQAGPRGRASSSRASACRARKPANRCAATRSPSASTRISPLCWRPSGWVSKAARSPPPASPMAAWRRRPKRAPGSRSGADRGQPWQSPKAGRRPSPRSRPTSRRITDMRASAAYRLQAAQALLRQGADRDRRRRYPSNPHHRLQGGGR